MLVYYGRTTHGIRWHATFSDALARAEAFCGASLIPGGRVREPDLYTRPLCRRCEQSPTMQQEREYEAKQTAVAASLTETEIAEAVQDFVENLV